MNIIVPILLFDLIAITSYDQLIHIYLVDVTSDADIFDGKCSEFGNMLETEDFFYLREAPVKSIHAKTNDNVISIGISYLDSVDAWRTADPNEEGVVVAYIDPDTKEVFYTNPDYRYDGFINTEIQSFLEEL